MGVTYHVNSTLEKTSFDFRFQIVKDELDVLETEACAKWTGESDASDMTVMEVGIISGFSLDSEQARKVREACISRSELGPANGSIPGCRVDHLTFEGEGGVEDFVSAIFFSPMINKVDSFPVEKRCIGVPAVMAN